jgi:uncharacterized membrane protein YdfJ with MMPL/SSD domain
MPMPSKYRPERLNQVLAWWVRLVQRTAFWVVLFSTLTTGVILCFTVKNLEINANLDTMLSKNLSFRRTYEDYQKAFPQDISAILLVIDGDTPDLAQDASKALAARLGEGGEAYLSILFPLYFIQVFWDAVF